MSELDKLIQYSKREDSPMYAEVRGDLMLASRYRIDVRELATRQERIVGERIAEMLRRSLHDAVYGHIVKKLYKLRMLTRRRPFYPPEFDELESLFSEIMEEIDPAGATAAGLDEYGEDRRGRRGPTVVDYDRMANVMETMPDARGRIDESLKRGLPEKSRKENIVFSDIAPRAIEIKPKT